MIGSLFRTFSFALLSFLIAANLVAGDAEPQRTPEGIAGNAAADTLSALPVLTGGMSLQSTFSPGTQVVLPMLNPIMLIPIGDRLLVESEFAIMSETRRTDGVLSPRRLSREIEYLQVDYLAHPNLTVVAGWFSTPFGIYNERYHPTWIGSLPILPIIFGISHMRSMGAEVRGAAHVSPGLQVTYTGFYAVNSTWSYLDSDRGAGGRVSLFAPGPGLEVGFSYNKRLGLRRLNLYAFDGTWNVRGTPLDLRTEVFKAGALGTGYWVEGAYRLKSMGHNAFTRNSEIAVRGEQYWAPTAINSPDSADMAAPMPGDDNYLPDRNTKRGSFGWNYYFSDAVRLSAAYSRSFAHEQTGNIYSLGLSYRFATGGRAK